MTPEEELIRIFAGLAIAVALIWFSLRVDGWRIRRMIREEVKKEIQSQKEENENGRRD